MRTEAPKHFHSGFILNETELRRIVGIAEDQIKNLPGTPAPTLQFEIKYRNGALATTSSIEEVLSQENHGTSLIVELRIRCFADNDKSDDSISIQFINPEFAAISKTESISYVVRGNSRDWVFITSSLLEERALKIRRIPLTHYLGGSRDSIVEKYILIALIGLVSGYFYSANFAGSNTPYPRLDFPQLSPVSNEFEAELRAKGIKDPIEALILREKLQAKREQESRASLDQQFEQMRQAVLQRSIKFGIPWYLQITLFGLLPVIGFFLVRAFLLKYYPSYNFCWGDYVDVFQRREAVRKFVFVVLILGVLVSFIGGILANLTRIGK